MRSAQERCAPWLLPALTFFLIATFAAGVCATHGSTARAGDRPTRTIAIVERDFRIKLASRVTRAGDVTLRVSNKGPDSHELIVVRRSAKLPLRHDGLTVDEDALEHVTAGTLEPGTAGAVRDLHVHLRRGRYELFCNMSGHYLGGMHVDLVVR